jgi:hypothetical protein
MPADPADYRLYRSQTAVMAAIRQAVAKGYRYYLVATTPEEKALGAVAKLHERHRVLLSPEARRARKEAGLPVAQLFLGPEPRGGVWPYALLATKRLEGEEMRSAEGKRPLPWVAWRKEAWLPTYELRKDGDTGRWTWYLTEAFYRELLEEAIHYTHTGNWPKLVAHLKTLANLPMFGGVFQQITDIRRRVQKLWGDTHLRSPEGQWKAPPWRKALEDWPKRPLAASVYLYVDPEVDGDRPRTLGEWWEARRKEGA